MLGRHAKGWGATLVLERGDVRDALQGTKQHAAFLLPRATLGSVSGVKRKANDFMYYVNGECTMMNDDVFASVAFWLGLAFYFSIASRRSGFSHLSIDMV